MRRDDFTLQLFPGERIDLSKAAQVRMCGNAVCPPLARALVEANFQHESQVTRRVCA